MDHFMTNDEWRTFKHDNKKFKSLSKSRYYCYCGHSVIINPPEERTLCKWCGHWVYRDKNKYFKERLKGYINENTIK